MIDWMPIDTWIVVTGILCAVSCALLGNFMVLRRLSMMGDAISHAVLPGLAIAFLITNSRNSIEMLIGAAIVGVLTAVFTQAIHHYGKVEQSAAMGVVFVTLFAIGLIMIEVATDLKQVDLDADCVLYGAIETVAFDMRTIGPWSVPAAVILSGSCALVNLVFVIVFYKELKISAFDSALATTLGINSQVMHYLLMTLVAVTTVAAFEIVGSILVIAMLIVPAAAAHQLTTRLPTMIIVSVVIAAFSAVIGHIAALTVPGILGFNGDTYSAAMMTVVAGLIFLASLFFAPHYGLVSKLSHRFGLMLEITQQDVLGLLYRLEEWPESDTMPTVYELLHDASRMGPMLYRVVIMRLRRADKVSLGKEGLELTNGGRVEARELIRSHRLWETYLFKHLHYDPKELHFAAEQFEHITDAEMRAALAERTDSPPTDPHGREIPGDTPEQ
jgi:manganese/zinc/iron transport system permease protein